MQHGKLVIIQLGLLCTVHRKDGVEAFGGYLCTFFFYFLFACLGHLHHVLRHAHLVALVTLRLAGKVVEDVRHVVGNVSGVFQELFRVDAPHLVIVHAFALAHGAHVVNLELQHVLVVDGIDDGIAMQRLGAVAFLVRLTSEKLCRGGKLLVLGGATGVLGKDGRTRKAEDIVFLEFLGNKLVHVAELRTVALVEYQHHILVQTVDVLSAFQQIA